MATTVLIADDQAEIREALELLVVSEPSFELVGLAEDADEAIELARQHQPHVALVDFKMPAGGGPRATREIRECSPGTKIVALSAYGDRNSIFQMLRAGAVGYLVKGASATEIHAAIARSAQGERVLSADVTAEVVHQLSEQLEHEAAAEALRHERTARVRRALDEGGLWIALQPIVELRERRPVGFEALARFTAEPQRSPAAWFAEATELGLGTELELAAMRIALRCVEMLAPDTYLSINVGPDTLLTPAASVLLEDVPLDRIVLEVTEHAPVSDYEALRRALRDFRGGGGRLAVDDAGAGFASLRHVLQLAPDVLKIDTSLVREIGHDQAARALTSALLTFAAEMEHTVVAEGVEDEETVAALEALGIRFGQGYHLGLPEPAVRVRP